MSTQVYAMSNGSYDDYRIHRFVRGPVGADFDTLFNEFCAEFHRLAPPYAVPFDGVSDASGWLDEELQRMEGRADAK